MTGPQRDFDDNTYEREAIQAYGFEAVAYPTEYRVDPERSVRETDAEILYTCDGCEGMYPDMCPYCWRCPACCDCSADE